MHSVSAKTVKLLRGHFSDRNVNIFVGTTPKEIPIRLDQSNDVISGSK